VLAGAVAVWVVAGRVTKPNALESRLAGIQELAPGDRVACEGVRAQRPLVLLVLGQSNAGNHGEPSATPGLPQVLVTQAGACGLSGDPLPGGTGRGASPWPLLRGQLAPARTASPIVIQLLAVDASALQDWIGDGSALRHRLTTMLAASKATGLAPALVLWQQGEADAQRGTSEEDYRRGLLALRRLLVSAGTDASIVMARSTVCRSAPYAPVRRAMAALASDLPTQFQLGPDTDQLVGPQMRPDGCHWSQAGLLAAATLWAEALAPIVGRLPR